MAAKDVKEKKFLMENKRFADIANFLLFRGEEVLRPEDLEERDSQEILELYEESENESKKIGTQKEKELVMEHLRDILKGAIIRYAKGSYFVLIGIENQSEISYTAPVRNMVYDAMNYNGQLVEARKRIRENPKGISKAEFLSGFRKTDRLTPVITLTVYWGASDWDGPRSLHEMLSVDDDRLLQHVADYKVNLLVPQEIKDFSKFRTSVGEVFEMIKASEDKRQMQEIINSNEAYRNLETDAVRMIKEFAGIDIPVEESEETMDMCKAWKDWRQEGVDEGVALGMERGMAQGMERGVAHAAKETAMKMLQDGRFTIEEIAEFSGLPVEVVEEL